MQYIECVNSVYDFSRLSFVNAIGSQSWRLQMFYLLGESFLKLYLIYGIMSVLGLKWLKHLAGVLM